MDVLSVVWWLSALAGGTAVLFAVLAGEGRRRALLVAAVLFTVVGVLSILSIGVVFIAAAVVCTVAGIRTGDDGDHPVGA